MTEFVVLTQLTAGHSRFIYWLVPNFYRRHLFFNLHVQSKLWHFILFREIIFFLFSFYNPLSCL